jgi:hypothetical protein
MIIFCLGKNIYLSEKPSWRKVCPTAISSTTNITRCYPGLNPEIIDEKLSCDSLSYNPALCLLKFLFSVVFILISCFQGHQKRSSLMKKRDGLLSPH